MKKYKYEKAKKAWDKMILDLRRMGDREIFKLLTSDTGIHYVNKKEVKENKKIHGKKD